MKWGLSRLPRMTFLAALFVPNRLLVLEGLDGIEASGAVGGQSAEEDADQNRSGECDDGRPCGDRDLEWRQ